MRERVQSFCGRITLLLREDCNPLTGGLMRKRKIAQKVLAFKIIKVTLQHETENINLK
jgi:GH43 family beta-xylosidase